MIGSEVKVSVDAGLERLNVICSQEDGREKRISVSKSHRNKRIGKCICSVSMQFNRKVMLNVRKLLIRANEAFRGIIDFIFSSE